MKRFSSALLSILILLSILGGCKKQEVPDQVNLPEQEQTNTPVAQTEPETETEQNWQTSEPEHLSIEIKLPEASVRHAQSYQEVFQLFSAARDDTDENNRYLPETVDSSVKVLGFDQDQTVKTDQSFVYILTAQELLIVSPEGAESQLVGKCSILGGYGKGTESPIAVFLYGRTAYVLFNYYAWSEIKDENGHYSYSSTEQVLIKQFDINDPENPFMTGISAIDGRYLAARQFSDRLYLASSFTAWNSSVEEYGRYIPSIVNGESSSLISPDRLYLIDPCQSSSFTVLGCLDMAEGTISENAVALTGTASQVLFTDKAVHVAIGSYELLQSEPYQENQYRVTDHVQLAATRLFTLQPDDFSVTASNSVEGFLVNRFAMDEWNGQLRLATSEYQNAYKTYVDEAYGFINYVNAGEERNNSISVFDDSLSMKGTFEIPAEFGTISSARFHNSLCFLLSNQRLDPGIVLNLADPETPKMLENALIPSNCGYWASLGKDQLFGLAVQENADSGLVPFLLDCSVSDPVEKARFGSSIAADSGYSVYIGENGILGLPLDGSYCFFDCNEGTFEPVAEMEMSSLYYRNGSIIRCGNALYLCTAASVQVISLDDYQLLCSLTFANG
ncbi:MAG: beta-propeller domain-containing protein [Oscillospiraceae bacterium]|nr:beta-propeller domain-containing protein [Oscillospiraceae bacterium]